MHDNTLNKIKIDFLKNEPLIGFLIYKIIIKYSDTIKTLAVYFDDKIFNYVMLINKNFFNKLTYKEKLAVIKHELFHIYFQHHIRFKDIKNLNHEVANIAADIAINQYIENLPQGALKPEDFNLPYNLNFEKYYKLLEKNNNNNNNDNIKKQLIIKGKKVIDNHKGLFKTVKNNNKKFVEEHTKNLLKSAFEHMEQQEKIYGKKYNLSKGIEDELRKIILKKEKPVINIDKIIFNWIQKEVLTNKYNYSWKYINRRFSNYKGKKRIKKRRIYIAIDTSYSIEEKVIEKFFNIIYNTLDLLNDEIYLLLFHTKIYYIKKLRKKENFSNLIKNIEIGGTNIQNVFDYVNKEKNNNKYLIILTDGMTSYPLKTYNINTLWINENIKLSKIIKKIILKKNPFDSF